MYLEPRYKIPSGTIEIIRKRRGTKMNVSTGRYDKDIKPLEKQADEIAKKIYKDIKQETLSPREIRRQIEAEKNASMYRKNRLADHVFDEVRDLLDEEIEAIQLPQ